MKGFEKNKKKRACLLLSICFLLIGLIGSFLLVNIQTSYAELSKAPTVWGADPKTGGDICGTEKDPRAHAVGCKCNYDYSFEKAKVHITCAQPSNQDSTTFLRCSTNAYNTSGVQVCLVQAKHRCTGATPMGNSTLLDASCEAGYKCKDASTCELDTGSDTFASGELGTEVSDIRDTIRTFINIALGFLGVLCVIFIIYGGVLWLTSSGSSDKVKKGKDTMIWAALGAIIITIAWTITSYVLHIGETVG